MSKRPLSREFEERINRARRLSWICEGLAVTSLVVGFVLCMSLMKMSERVQVLSQLIPKDMQSSDDFMFSDAISLDVDMLAQEELDELFVRRYILLRHENFQDPQAAEMRIGKSSEMASMSSPEVHLQFLQSIASSKSADDGVEKFSENPVSSVEFKHIYHRKNSNTWQVSFDKVFPDSRGQIRHRVPYTASVVAGHVEGIQHLSAQLANPLGFAVIQYDESIQK